MAGKRLIGRLIFSLFYRLIDFQPKPLTLLNPKPPKSEPYTLYPIPLPYTLNP